MQLPVTYVWTHDSIGLGEDGPTHQPVEHLAALRAIPGLDVVRPADANETVAAWKAILENPTGPAALCLTRQNVPTFPRGTDGDGRTGRHRAASPGAATSCSTPTGTPDVVLVGTGSEVQLAVEAREQLAAKDIAARVVSMPCREWFDAQDPGYRDSVLPPEVRARVSVEAGVAQGWREVVGDAGRIVSLEHFGASAQHTELFEKFGFTAAAVVRAAEDSIRAAADADAAARRDARTRTTEDAPLEGTTWSRPTAGPTGRAVRSRRLDLARRPVPRAHRDRQPRRAGRATSTSSGSPPTRRSSPPRSPTASGTTTRWPA